MMESSPMVTFKEFNGFKLNDNIRVENSPWNYCIIFNYQQYKVKKVNLFF